MYSIWKVDLSEPQTLRSSTLRVLLIAYGKFDCTYFWTRIWNPRRFCSGQWHHRQLGKDDRQTLKLKQEDAYQDESNNTSKIWSLVFITTTSSLRPEVLYASAKTRSRVTTPITFSRQNDAGSRAHTTLYWENLVLVHFFAFICLNWLYYLYHVIKRFFFIVMLLCLKQSIVFILSFQLLKLKCMQRLYSSFIIFVFICWRVLRSEPVTTIYKHFTKNIISYFL